jgi:hypothetical protein
VRVVNKVYEKEKFLISIPRVKICKESSARAITFDRVTFQPLNLPPLNYA